MKVLEIILKFVPTYVIAGFRRDGGVVAALQDVAVVDRHGLDRRAVGNEGHRVLRDVLPRLDGAGLACADALGVVGVGQAGVGGVRVRLRFKELAAVLPRKSPVAVSRRVAAAVVGDAAGRAVSRDGFQQILPVAGAVGVGLVHATDQDAGMYRALFHLPKVARRVVGIVVGDGDIRRGAAAAVVIDLADELILRVILVFYKDVIRIGALGDLRDVSQCVVGILFALQKRAVLAEADDVGLDLRGRLPSRCGRGGLSGGGALCPHRVIGCILDSIQFSILLSTCKGDTYASAVLYCRRFFIRLFKIKR